MARELALLAAEPDALGFRWARAYRSGRVYLAWRDAEGREGVEIKHRRDGRTLALRIPAPPEGLCWLPLAPVIREVAG